MRVCTRCFGKRPTYVVYFLLLTFRISLLAHQPLPLRHLRLRLYRLNIRTMNSPPNHSSLILLCSINVDLSRIPKPTRLSGAQSWIMPRSRSQACGSLRTSTVSTESFYDHVLFLFHSHVDMLRLHSDSTCYATYKF
jgi:hypothetical protein